MYYRDGEIIVELDVDKLVKRQVEAVKAWLRELYVQQIAAVESATWGWYWFAAAMRRPQLKDYVANMSFKRLTRLVLFVDRVVRRCEEIDEDKLYYLATRHGLRARRRKSNRYRESDYEILRDTLDVIKRLNGLYREKNC